MDNFSDQLLSNVLQNLVDVSDFRNCKLVSQRWRRNVVEACRNKFHLVYPLTDSTLHTVSELKDAQAQVSFNIYSFTGEGNEDAWETSGIEPLIQTTEWLQFTGSKVKDSEIQKILDLAQDSLKTLSFRCLRKDLTLPFLRMELTFNALTKLSIRYYSTNKENHAFKNFKNTVENWKSLDCRVQLPALESLHLYLDCRSGHASLNVSLSTEDMFQNYIAIAKLLLKYKETLKDVQIERVIVYFVFFNHGIQPGWSEMERGLEALDDLNLNRLKLSTEIDNGYSHFTNYDIGMEVWGRPKNLKNVLFHNLMFPYDNWNPLIATLSSFDNSYASYLTSLKINLALRQFHDPTMYINLEGLRDCNNLRTLWLIVNLSTNPAPTNLFVRNVELLPRGLSSLRFESAIERRHTMGQEILVNQQQVRWIIENLRELESCRMSLIIPEQANANYSNEQREDVAADDNDNDEDIDNEQISQQEEEVTRLVNINLDTFRALVAMPKLKDLKVDIVKGRTLALALRPWLFALREGLGTTLDDVRKYSDLCEAAGFTATITTTPNFGANQFRGFATLTVQRNQN